MSHRQNEEGAVLVLALAFVVVFGVVISALLGVVDAGQRAGVAVADTRDDLYALESAVNAAAQQIRDHRGIGVAGGACGPATFEIADRDVAVTCAGAPGSGVGSGGADVVGENAPPNAILTLADDPQVEDGLVITSNSPLKVGGDVVVHSSARADAANARLSASGSIAVGGTCVGSFDPACSPLAAVDAEAYAGQQFHHYPRWSEAPPEASRLPRPGVPDCGAFVTKFEPGLYDDATALNILFDGEASNACPENVFWFKRGVYYFDFRGTQTEWRITGRGSDLVGGTPNGWDPSATSRPTVPFPGGCVAGPNDGVQFIFGGESRMFIENSEVQLCASRTTHEQQIAIYGNESGPTTPDSRELQPAPSAQDHARPTDFLLAERGYAIDGQASEFTVSNRSTASLKLTDFDLSGMSHSAYVTGFKVRVAHEERGSVDAVLRVSTNAGLLEEFSSPSGQGNCDEARRLCRGGPQDQRLTFTSPPTRASDLAGLSIEYEIVSTRNNQPGTGRLDGVELVIAYEEPTYRGPENTCLDNPYYKNGRPLGGSSCPLVKTEGADTGLWVAGTIYAPAAALDIQLTRGSDQVIARGVIARSLIAGITPANNPDPNLDIIDLDLQRGNPSDRVVVFTATTPPGSGDPEARLVSRVRYHDDDGVNPGRAISVESWRFTP